jgi:hypothetical protein
MANTTITTADAWIPELWSMETLKFTKANLVMANLINNILVPKGDVYHQAQLTEIAAGDKAASTAVTFTAPTETNIDTSINKHKHVSVRVEDNANVKANFNVPEEYASQMGYELAKQIDSDIHAIHATLSQNVSAGAAIVDADILQAVRLLDVADAPEEGRNFVIHPEAKEDILALDKHSLVSRVGEVSGQSRVQKGLMGEAYGLKFYVTTQVVETAGSPNILHNLAFHKDALRIAMQRAPQVHRLYQPENLAWDIVADVIYGVSELRDTFAVDVELNS